MADRGTRLALRREAKFGEHAITVKQEPHTEIRTFERQNEGGKKEQYDMMFDFKFAVRAGKRLIGRTHTRRSALKRAHQACRDLRPGR